MIPRFPVYLFDIDGTLLDSAQDICGAVRQVLVGKPCPEYSFEYLKGYIGQHLIEMFRDFFPRADAAHLDELIEEYRRVYPARGHTLTRVFPGVAETLAALGGRKGTATTKGTASARAVLEQFGLAKFFEHVQGTDGFPSKPAPDVILTALAAMGASPAECLMVGDSAADMEAGRRAGVRTCAVSYGYGLREDLERFHPDYCVSDLRELLRHPSVPGIPLPVPPCDPIPAA